MQNNLKKLRIDKKLKQKDVANMINVSPKTYSKYETGDTECSYDILKKLSDFYEVSIDYLLCKTHAVSEFNDDEILQIRKTILILSDKFNRKD